MTLQRVPPVDAYVFTRNMGTSVEIIRLQYDHTTNSQNATELTRGRGNVARRRSNKGPERGFSVFWTKVFVYNADWAAVAQLVEHVIRDLRSLWGNSGLKTLKFGETQKWQPEPSASDEGRDLTGST